MNDFDHIDGKRILLMSSRDLMAFLDAFYQKIKAEHELKEEEWIDAETAKGLLKVASTTLYKLRSSNQIKISQYGKTILYSRSSIQDFIETNIKTIS